MRTLFFFLAVIFSMIIVSCKSDRPEQIAKIGEVMKIHDDVMPKMDQIVDLQGKVKLLIEEIRKDSVNLDKRKLETAQKVLKDLNEADAGMWDWMNGFKMPEKDDPRPHSEIMQYLNEQQASMEKVRDMMLNSIEDGNKILNENE